MAAVYSTTLRSRLAGAMYPASPGRESYNTRYPALGRKKIAVFLYSTRFGAASRMSLGPGTCQFAGTRNGQQRCAAQS